MDLGNASPCLESHESHVEEGKSYDFGHVPHMGSKLKFKLQCEQRFLLFPTTYLFPVGARTGNIVFLSYTLKVFHTLFLNDAPSNRHPNCDSIR